MNSIQYSNLKSALLSQGVRLENGLQLKSVTLAPKSKWPRGTTLGVTFQGVDFNSPIIGGFFRPIIKGCSFIDCSLDGVNSARCVVEGTDFQGVVFGPKLVSTFCKVRFNNCSFVACEFQNAQFVNCRFSNCNFDDCSWRGVGFEGCEIYESSFKGKMSQVVFTGGSSCKVDCSCLQFDELASVKGARWDQVVWPSGPDNFVLNDVTVLNEIGRSLGCGLDGYISDVGFLETLGRPVFISRESFPSITDEQRGLVFAALKGAIRN